MGTSLKKDTKLNTYKSESKIDSNNVRRKSAGISDNVAGTESTLAIFVSVPFHTKKKKKKQ